MKCARLWPVLGLRDRHPSLEVLDPDVQCTRTVLGPERSAVPAAAARQVKQEPPSQSESSSDDTSGDESD